MNVTLRRGIATAAVVLAAPGLAACGFDVPTNLGYQPAVGTNARGSTVDVLNALVVSGEDGSGTLVAGVANQDQQDDDALLGVAASGPSEGRVTVEIADGAVPLPADDLVGLADEAEVTVEGPGIKAGFIIELTFRFESAETVTLKLPVQEQQGPYADIAVPSDEEAPSEEEVDE